MSSKFGGIAKALVSVCLLAWVFSRVDWAEFGEGLRHARLDLAFVYFWVGPLMLFVSTLKWRVLLRAKGLVVSLWRLYGLYYVGHFFNHLMPSNVGGDAVRTYQLGRETGSFQESLASVFVERMSGFTILLALAVASLGLNLQLLGDPRLAWSLMLGSLLAYAGVMWLALDPRPLQLLTRRLRLPLLERIAPKLEEVHWAIRSYHQERQPGLWPSVMGLSLLFYSLIILNAWIGCRVFGGEPEWTQLLMAIPVILLVAMLPISVGGIGLLEWGYFAVFEQVGLPGSLGLSVALLNRLAGLLMGAAGGFLYGSMKIERAPDKPGKVAMRAPGTEKRAAT